MSILDEAAAIIYGDREKTYGEPSKNLDLISRFWSAYTGSEIDGRDVCIMMTLLKCARLANDPAHRDSAIDGCGYLALLERIQK